MIREILSQWIRGRVTFYDVKTYWKMGKWPISSAPGFLAFLGEYNALMEEALKKEKGEGEA